MREENFNKEKLIHETKYCYDRAGNIIKAVMSDGLTVAYTYYGLGRKSIVAICQQFWKILCKL